MVETSKKGTVVVFGGSGFVGSHVAEALSEAGYRVRIFDLRRSPFLRADQEMFLGDIMDISQVEKAVFGCDYVYNFAGLADLDEARGKPIEAAKLNVLGNVHVLEASVRAGIKRYVYASTVYVYSGAGAFYRASKQSAEHFVETYHQEHGLPYTILRYGSLYGRRADERNGIYRLVKQALETKTISYDGDGEEAREYIHVTDAARLSVKILAPEFANRNIILTGHERWKVKDLMRMIAEMMAAKYGKVELKFSHRHHEGHYEMTPYSFSPALGHKLVASDFVDLGQGILDALVDIHEKGNSKPTEEQE